MSEKKDNNFDFLRLFASLLVLYGHANQFFTYCHSVYFIIIGLGIFFSISGYLVTRSCYLHSRSRYLAGRAFRIFPALGISTLFTAFVLGPIASSLPLKTYFLSASTYFYLSNILLLENLSLPGVFEHLHNNSSVINGALWTLPLECALYTFILFLSIFLGFQRKIWALILCALIFLYMDEISFKPLTALLLRPYVIGTFFIGSF